jgi:diadenylate cyclase
LEALIDYLHRIAANNPLGVVIELVLIGLVVYWIIDFLEGTRGERLFRGVIVIIIASVLLLNLVADRFELQRLQYLYNYFLVFVLVVAVAAFQPEIRRALIRIAQPTFLSGSSQKLTRTVEEISTAVHDMSKEKTGAIIVIERRVALGEFIETGVRIDAKVTAELLKTIFYEGTALHDMAVIIRSDRIVSARVQLPLAEAGRMEGEELGSRHRAAIGLTTSCDASVIVVSEETGIISIAVNGKLIRNVDQSQLRKHLTSIISRHESASWLWRTYRRATVVEAEDIKDKSIRSDNEVSEVDKT